MNDFEGLLSSDFGFKPQGKSAPMSSSKPPSSNRSTSSSPYFDLGSRTSSSSTDPIFASKPAQSSQTLDDFGDIFGGPARRVEKSDGSRANSSFDLDSMFNSSAKSSSAPVYDKPVYDDDIFVGVPGMKTSASSGVKYDDVFESISSTSPPSRRSATSSGFDDLLGGFGNRESQQPKSKKEDPVMPDFDDLIPGFGEPYPTERSIPKSTWSSEPVAPSPKAMGDSFEAPGSASPPTVSSSGVSLDPFEEFSVLGKSRSTKADAPSVPSGVVLDDLDPFDGLGKSVSPSSPDNTVKGKDRNPLDDLDPFDGLGKSVPPSSPDNTVKGKDRNPLNTDQGNSESRRYNDGEQSDLISQKTAPVDDDLESHQKVFNMSSPTGNFSASIHSHEKPSSNEANIPADTPPGYEENIDTSDDVWLTVSEIPLFTQTTRGPPPSRPPPPRPARAPKVGSSSFGSASVRKANEFSPFTNSTQNFDDANSTSKARTATIDELEDFAMGRTNGNNIDEHVNGASSEEMGMYSDAAASAAAMKEAMDRAEVKFRHAKEVRERQSTKSARSRESVQLEKDENWLDAEERALREKQEMLEQERLQREKEKEREQRRLEKEREREEKEREQQRLEKEREQQRLERERARQVVERANREARERAVAEARLKAERAAVEKAHAEARERAERAAVLRAQAEARERAAAEARERAERAAVEAREKEARERAAEARARAEKAEKAAAEAREKEARERAVEARRRAERAAVERAAAEARERAAVEARERAAASARAKQQSNDNDLESFFSMGRASSVPRPRADYSDPVFDVQFPSKKGPEVTRTSDSNPTMRKASSSANIVDDLSSIFGGVSASGEFQDVEGESEERRRARLERHQRTQERAAKALAEKNQRDLQAQREQAERHRIAESLDVEIKRWAAGKEGNLRALLSTLQYVLWPECGWQPVSLTDLITAAAVKKVYRKATLCIHPDKVQQKGANLQQKYVAEKVFDLLKEAWNKLNSEELF